SFGEAWNFGPSTNDAATVRTVIEYAQRSFGGGKVEWGTVLEGPHEAGLLMLEPAKARARLGIVPRWDLRESIDRTVKWYRAVFDGANPGALCLEDIARFEMAI